jgi:hypothetical protein
MTRATAPAPYRTHTPGFMPDPPEAPVKRRQETDPNRETPAGMTIGAEGAEAAEHELAKS